MVIILCELITFPVFCLGLDRLIKYPHVLCISSSDCRMESPPRHVVLSPCSLPKPHRGITVTQSAFLRRVPRTPVLMLLLFGATGILGRVPQPGLPSLGLALSSPPPLHVRLGAPARGPFAAVAAFAIAPRRRPAHVMAHHHGGSHLEDVVLHVNLNQFNNP